MYSVTQAAQAAAAADSKAVNASKKIVKGLKANKNLAAKAMYKTEQKGPVIKEDIFSGDKKSVNKKSLRRNEMDWLSRYQGRKRRICNGTWWRSAQIRSRVRDEREA